MPHCFANERSRNAPAAPSATAIGGVGRNRGPPPLKLKRGAASRLAGNDEIDGLWSFALFVGLDVESNALALHK